MRVTAEELSSSLNPLLIREGFKLMKDQVAIELRSLNPLLIREGFKLRLSKKNQPIQAIAASNFKVN